MARPTTLLATIFAFAFAFAMHAVAHDDHAEVVADARNASERSTLEGTVRDVTVEDEVSHATHAYRLIVTQQGDAHLLRGDVAQLQPGARYSVLGTSNGRYFETESAAVAARPAARSALAATPYSIDGTLRLGHIDYTDRPSVYFFAVFAEDGRRKQIPGAQLFDALQNGMEVSASGSIDTDGAFSAEHIVVHRHAAPDAANELHLKAASTHTVFVVPVKFPNAAAVYPAEPFTTAALNTAVFGASPVQSVTQYYKEVSYGQQTLTGTTASTGTPAHWLAATNTPPVDSKGKPTCDINFIQDQGTAAATAAGYTAANLNPGNMSPGSTGTANHVVFVFTSTGFSCGWSGLAYIGYGLAFVKQTSALSVISHELGHTFGLYHAGSLDCGANPIGGACTVSEYGDPYDVMGNSSAMHFSAFQKQTLKWISDASVTTHASGAATYTLNPIETPGGARYAVRIPAGPNRTYWLEYRQPLGFDSGISAVNADGAQVRVTRPFETLCSGCDTFSNDTELLDMTPGTTTFADATLKTGSRFVDNYYGIAIDVLSRTASALTVRVSSLGKGIGPDFNANATTDLVLRNSATGQTNVWLMNGVSATQTAVLSTDTNWRVTHQGDFNGDGKTDLVLRNTATGQTAIRLMNGTSTLASAVIFPIADWVVQATGDFDGDGRTDLLWRNSATGQTAIWLMNGLSGSAAAVIFPIADWTVHFVGDFDGDGKSDLLWRNTATGQTAIWLMNGLNGKSSAVIFPIADWIVEHVGDFNGDGKADLLWRNPVSGQSAVWLMNGLGSTAAVVSPGITWKATEVGDFDGDGKTDIVWRSSSGATQLWLMNGFTASSQATLPSDSTMSVVGVGDFDGDGRSDLAWRTTGGQTIIWLMNGVTTAQSATILGDPAWSIQLPQ